MEKRGVEFEARKLTSKEKKKFNELRAKMVVMCLTGDNMLKNPVLFLLQVGEHTKKLEVMRKLSKKLKNFHQKFSSWDNIENLFQRQEFTITELNKIETKELEEELTASQQKGELTEIRNKLTKSIIGNFCVQPTLSELEAAEQISQLVVKENNLEIVASNLRLVAYQLNKIIQEFAKTKLDKDTERSI